MPDKYIHKQTDDKKAIYCGAHTTPGSHPTETRGVRDPYGVETIIIIIIISVGRSEGRATEGLAHLLTGSHQRKSYRATEGLADWLTG